MKRTLSLVFALVTLCVVGVRASSPGGWSDQTARTVGASTTQYTYLLSTTNGSFNSTESNRQNYAPNTFCISNLAIRTAGPQPSDGSLVCTVRVNAADSACSVTVTANAAAGTYETLGGSVKVSKGDLIDLKCVNSSASVSAGIFEVRFMTD